MEIRRRNGRLLKFPTQEKGRLLWSQGDLAYSLKFGVRRQKKNMVALFKYLKLCHRKEWLDSFWAALGSRYKVIKCTIGEHFLIMCFPGGWDGKMSAYNAGDSGSIPVRKILWRRKWHPTPVLLTGKSHGQEEPGKLQSMGSQRVRQDWAIFFSNNEWS